MTFGQNLRILREHVGLSRIQLAERLGVSRQAVRQYELSTSLNERTVREYLAALGLTLNERPLWTVPSF